MTQPGSNSSQQTAKGLRLIVPREQTISVEHPCIVKNAEKAIDMIGGGSAIVQALDTDSVKTFALSFHPQDPAAHTIIANRRQTDNVLLSITVPKRTGRKRKRGSNDPWIEDDHLPALRKDSSYLLRSLVDNPKTHNVRALSAISSTHVWRSMPDLAFSTANSQILEDVKSKILSQNYPSIKEFDIPKTHGLENTSTLPPRVWSNQSIPINYAYRQNPSVKLLEDPVTGKATWRNTQEAQKIYNYQVQWDTVDYPTAPMPGIPPLEEASDAFKNTTAILQKLFDERPIWTRRALLNQLSTEVSSLHSVRYCLAYVAFAARSGPWRDTHIRLGVDPRTDPKYRFYQTVMLQLVPKQNPASLEKNYQPGLRLGASTTATETVNAEDWSAIPETAQRDAETRQAYARSWSRPTDKKSHIFDGVSPVPPDGKVWQLCDIIDPQLVALRDIPAEKLRLECDNRYFGWYWNGTSAKIRVVMRAKVDALMNGKILDPSELEPLLKLADNIDPTETEPPRVNPDNSGDDIGTIEHPERAEGESAYMPAGSTRQQVEWAAQYRGLARTGPGVPTDEVRERLKERQVAVSKKATVPKKSKPVSQKKASQDQRRETVEQLPEEGCSTPAEITTEEVIMVDDNNNTPELVDGEDVLPSIELDGFGEDQDDGSELGLDVKMEDDDENDFTGSAWTGPLVIDPDQNSG